MSQKLTKKKYFIYADFEDDLGSLYLVRGGGETGLRKAAKKCEGLIDIRLIMFCRITSLL